MSRITHLAGLALLAAAFFLAGAAAAGLPAAGAPFPLEACDKGGELTNACQNARVARGNARAIDHVITVKSEPQRRQ